MGIISATSSKNLAKQTTFANYLLILNAYSRIQKLYGMENITTEEVMDRQYVFQERFVKVDEFGWWDMDIIQTDAGTQFTSNEFWEGLSVHGVKIALAPPYHQEING